MWHAAIRDLVRRRRRYAISVAGTALVLAVGLSVNAGMPMVVIPLATLQEAFLGGLSLAIGTSSRALAGGVAMQAASLALVAALFGVGLAFLLAPVFPMTVELSVGALLGLPVLAVLTGVLSGVFALRRAISVEPAEAFGGAA